MSNIDEKELKEAAEELQASLSELQTIFEAEKANANKSQQDK